MNESPKPETVRVHIDSSDPDVIYREVLLMAARFCMLYECTAIVTEVVTVGEDGKLYRGYEIEKKTPAVNH